MEYSKKRAEYFEKTDPKLIRAINKARVAKGKSKIRYKGPPRRPTSFIKFALLPSHGGGIILTLCFFSVSLPNSERVLRAKH